jgi:hypothetical protein
MSGLWRFRHGKPEICLCAWLTPYRAGGCYGDRNMERLGGFHE